MKKTYIFPIIASIAFSFPHVSYGQEQAVGKQHNQEETGRVFVLREAQDFRNTGVAVEGYLRGDILEIKVEARMYAQRPKISAVKVVGPKLGSQSYQAKESILAGIEEEDPFETTQQQGIFRIFEERKKTKKLEGTVTKELFKIKIPPDKIIEGKRYWLWIYVESKTEGGHADTFKFELKDFPEKVAHAMNSAIQ